MLKMNEPILVDDPYRLLRFERGIFEVVSPTGERLRVVCPPGTSPILPAKTLSAGPETLWWRIEKVAEE